MEGQGSVDAQKRKGLCADRTYDKGVTGRSTKSVVRSGPDTAMMNMKVQRHDVHDCPVSHRGIEIRQQTRLEALIGVNHRCEKCTYMGRGSLRRP